MKNAKTASARPHWKHGNLHRRGCGCYTCRIYRMHQSSARLMEKVKNW